jgi:uncharacterized protein DUF3617
MTSPSLRRLGAAATLLLLGSLPLSTGAAEQVTEAKAQGELWEVTSQMSMEGMPMAMPAQKAKACTAKEWKEPPGAADERRKCRNTDFRSEGSKVSWKVVCAGPPEMNGVGEITRDGDDAYSGSIKFTTPDGNMTVKLNGKRVGACELPQK